MKRCTKCLVEKYLSAFSADKCGKSGLCAACKECRRIDDANYRKNNPEKVKAALAACQKKRPEVYRAKSARYRKKNPEKVKAGKADYRKKKPEVYRAANARRRAREHDALLSWIGEEPYNSQIAAIYTEARRLEELTGEPHHVDHILPLCSPTGVPPYVGLHVPWNLRPLPGRENLSKGNRTRPRHN